MIWSEEAALEAAQRLTLSLTPRKIIKMGKPLDVKGGVLWSREDERLWKARRRSQRCRDKKKAIQGV